MGKGNEIGKRKEMEKGMRIEIENLGHHGMSWEWRKKMGMQE